MNLEVGPIDITSVVPIGRSWRMFPGDLGAPLIGLVCRRILLQPDSVDSVEDGALLRCTQQRRGPGRAHVKRHTCVAGILLLCSCGNEPTGTLPENGLVASLRVTDEQGKRTSMFAYGDDIHFEYRLSNWTGTSVQWNQPYYSVLAGFSVFLGQDNLGSTLLGLDIQDAGSGALQSGETVAYETSWLSNPGSAWLPPGDYEVWASSTREFEDHPRPAQQTMRIKVVPRMSGDELVFGLYYETWTFGIFCLQEGDLYWASIFKSRRGDYNLTGAVLVESDATGNDCLPELVTGNCLRQSIIGPRVLSGTQVSSLLRLMAEFPQVVPEVNTACDPCLWARYHFGEAIHRTSPCATGPAEYVAHVGDLARFMIGVALEP